MADLPGLPPVPSTITDPEVRQWMTSVLEAVSVRVGQRGDPLDRSPTLRELLLANAVKLSGTGSSGVTASSGSGSGGGESDFVGSSDGTFTDLTPPVTATSVEVFANPRSAVLIWDKPQQNNIALAEIHRGDTDVLEDAVLIGVSPGQNYADTNVVTGNTYFYWVRYVTYAAVAGAWHSLTPLETTIPQLTDADIATLDVDKIIGNKASFVSANITDGSITNAKIADQISSDNYDTGIGWRLGKDGIAILNDVYARGDIEASSIKAGVADIVDTLMLRDNAVTFPSHFKSTSTLRPGGWENILNFYVPYLGGNTLILACTTCDMFSGGGIGAAMRILVNGSAITTSGSIYGLRNTAGANGVGSGITIMGSISSPAQGGVMDVSIQVKGSTNSSGLNGNTCGFFGCDALVIGLKK